MVSAAKFHAGDSGSIPAIVELSFVLNYFKLNLFIFILFNYQFFFQLNFFFAGMNQFDLISIKWMAGLMVD